MNVGVSFLKGTKQIENAQITMKIIIILEKLVWAVWGITKIMLQLIAGGIHEFEVLYHALQQIFYGTRRRIFYSILSLGDFLYPLLGSFTAEVHIVWQ